MLNELDKELTRRGHLFVRYADDSMIFCRSKSAAKQTKESITRFIEGKLHLRVNKEKTTVSYVKGVKYLGYSFYNSKGKFELCVHSKSKVKMKLRLKELTGRSNGMVMNVESKNLRNKRLDRLLPPCQHETSSP